MMKPAQDGLASPGGTPASQQPLFLQEPHTPVTSHSEAETPATDVQQNDRADPNEPQKPVSAYALFFRDTQAAIKGQNPNASFGEVSKIVASMWDGLDTDHKSVYNQKAEVAKKEYHKALAAHRASLVSKGGEQENQVTYNHSGSNGNSQDYVPNSLPQACPPQNHAVGKAHGYQANPSNYLLQSPQSSQSTQSPNIYQSPSGVPHSGYNQVQSQPSPVDITHTAMQYQNSQQIETAQQYPHYQQQQSNQPQQEQQQITSISKNEQYSLNSSGNCGEPQQSSEQNENQSVTSCIRQGCTNPAVSNSGWDDEYCCNECVVSHCKDVFSSWVASNANKQIQNFSAVK